VAVEAVNMIVLQVQKMAATVEAAAARVNMPVQVQPEALPKILMQDLDLVTMAVLLTQRAAI
jgi:hypothetical protein